MTISTSHYVSVNIGSSANDGTGDDLRTAFSKVNQNFANYEAVGIPTQNIVASGIIQTAGLTATSNIINAGSQIETGYQQLKPTGNIAVTANIGVNRILLHPTGTIVSFGANITLPNTQADGTIISISSNVTIAGLAVTPNWNGVVSVSPFGNVGPISAGTVNRFMYIAADKIWYKIA